MASRLDPLDVEFVVTAIRAGVVPGTESTGLLARVPGLGARYAYQQYFNPLYRGTPPPMIRLWKNLNPRGFAGSTAPGIAEFQDLVFKTEPITHPNPEEVAEVAAIMDPAWMNPGRGATVQVFVRDPLVGSREPFGPTNPMSRKWSDAKPFIMGLPRLEKIFLKFPWDSPVEHWSGAWTSVVGLAKIEELSRLAYSGVSDADLDAAFRTTIAQNADAITDKAGKTFSTQQKSRAKQNLLRVLGTVAIGVMTAGAIGPLVGAIASSAIKVPDQIKAARDAADATKAQDAAAAAQQRDAAEAQADAFYAQYPGPFVKEGYTVEVWKNLSFDQKVAVMQVISKGQKPTPPPVGSMPSAPSVPSGVPSGSTYSPGTNTWTDPDGDTWAVGGSGVWENASQKSRQAAQAKEEEDRRQREIQAQPSTGSYSVVIEGSSAGSFDTIDQAAAKAAEISNYGDRVDIEFNGQPTTLGLRTDQGIVPIPKDVEVQVRAMSPPEIQAMLKRAKETAAATPAQKGGFPGWILAPAAIAVALVASK